MKIVIRIGIIAVCLLAFVYFGQAQKANKIKEIRLRAKYENGQLTQAQYESLKNQNSLLKTLLNPQEVLKAD